MDLTEALVADLNVALNESDPCGLSYDRDACEARFLLEVLALPRDGPVDPDPRRALVLRGVSALCVWLEQESPGGGGPHHCDPFP
jgi:hypothetical protein